MINTRLALFVPLAAALCFACGGSSPPASLSSAEAAVTSAAATSTPSLGAASGFAVLGGAGVTCTASTVVTGDVGSLLTVTQTPTCTIAGGARHIHEGDATANLAFNDFATAYDAFKGMTCPPANPPVTSRSGSMMGPPQESA